MAALRLVLAGSKTEDLQQAAAFLRGKGAADVRVVGSQSEVLQLLQSPADVRRMVLVAEVKTSGDADAVDALALLQTVPASRRPPIAVMLSNQDDSVFTACVKLGALEILQAPISEQADRLHFHTAKWHHTLQKRQQQQQQSGAEFGADFSMGLGDSAPDSFSLDIPQLGTQLSGESLDELLGPGSATSCGTALCASEWDQSEQLAQSILPGVFGDDDGASGASPFDMHFDPLASCEAALLLDQPVEGETAHAQPSGSSDSSVSHLPSISRQASLVTCGLSGKRKSEECSEHSRGCSSDTSRDADLMDDARCKKHKVEWTPELHAIFAAAVEKVGVDLAVPSQILADMGTAGRGLTRQNIASHLQKHRARSRACEISAGSLTRAATPLGGRAASAPAGFGAAACEPASGVPLLPLSPCQLPAILPGVPCWSAGGVAAPGAHAQPAGWAAWPLVPLPPPAAPHVSQPSAQLIASLQQAMHEPAGKLPIGLQLDASAVLSKWGEEPSM